MLLTNNIGPYAATYLLSVPLSHCVDYCGKYTLYLLSHWVVQ